MKKLLLSLGTVAAVAAPVASVIACGSTTTAVATTTYTKDDTNPKATIDFGDSEVNAINLGLAAADLATKFGTDTMDNLEITLSAKDKDDLVVTLDTSVGGDGELDLSASTTAISNGITASDGWAKFSGTDEGGTPDATVSIENDAAIKAVTDVTTEADADVVTALETAGAKTGSVVIDKAAGADKAFADDDTVKFNNGVEDVTLTLTSGTWTAPAAAAGTGTAAGSGTTTATFADKAAVLTALNGATIKGTDKAAIKAEIEKLLTDGGATDVEATIAGAALASGDKVVFTAGTDVAAEADYTTTWALK